MNESDLAQKFVTIKTKYERKKAESDYAIKALKVLKTKAKKDNVDLKTLNKDLRELTKKADAKLVEIENELEVLGNELD